MSDNGGGGDAEVYYYVRGRNADKKEYPVQS